MATESSRAIALRHVERLQAARHLAYWVGGCVRDMLLGHEPKDIDIATSAPPDVVLDLLPGSTLVGASFGVVLAPGRVEIATFRSESSYHDGRRPSEVRYETDPALDAARRDFTINAIYFDPVSQDIHDFTGGQQDLKTGIIRAIGNAQERFNEDHLRLLRAVRFAARFGYTIEPTTFEAIRELAPKLTRIAGERIHDEMRRILTGPNLDQVWQLLDTTGLFKQLVPEARSARLARLQAPINLALGWAALLEGVADPSRIFRTCNFSNEERQACRRLLESESRFAHLDQLRIAALKRFLRLDDFDDHLRLHIATHGGTKAAEQIRRWQQQWSHEDLHPQPLLDGNDLLTLGIPAGPAYRDILHRIEDAQLEGTITTRDQAVALALA